MTELNGLDRKPHFHGRAESLSLDQFLSAPVINGAQFPTRFYNGLTAIENAANEGNLYFDGSDVVLQAGGGGSPAFEGFYAVWENLNIAPNPGRNKLDITNMFAVYEYTNSFNATTGLYTVPVTGIYSIDMTFNHQTDAMTPAQHMSIQIKRDTGATGLWSLKTFTTSGDNYNTFATTTAMRFTAGQVLGFTCTPNSNGNQKLYFRGGIRLIQEVA